MNTTALGKSLSTLLQIENDNELIGLNCTATGLPVWPLIRVAVLRTIMSDWLYKSEPLSSIGQNVNFAKLAKGAAVSAIHNLGYKPNPQRNILIQNTGWGNYYRDGLVHDRLISYFAQTLPNQTLVYQDKSKGSLLQRYSFSPILHKSPRNIIYNLRSKLVVNNNHKTMARRVISRVVDNAAAMLNYKFEAYRVRSLINSLACNLAALPYASGAYANWFSVHGFKLLLKEDACYGGSDISIIHAAKLCGMVVAEYQHGAISKGHDAYNVSEALAKLHSFKAVLPDYLLTYGNWWSNQTNMPVQKISIGNPHLTEVLGSIGTVINKRNQVLVLGDGVETKMYLDLVGNIFKIANEQGFTVVFRPHPFERDKINPSMLPQGVQLDSNPYIYSSMKESRVVIGEVSTGLFEAVGLVDRVLLWETDKSRLAYPEIPFTSFSTMDELELILRDKDIFAKKSLNVQAAELWEPNWRQNYLRFVEGVVGQ